MTRPLNVIFLPSWYPVKAAPLNGIFNRELAELISEIHHVHLLHITFGDTATIDKEFHQVNANFTETIITIPEKGNQLLRQWRYFNSFFQWMKKARKSMHPDLMHVQVAWKMGLPAWLAKWRYGLRYVVTEHYTGYMPEDGELKGWKRNFSLFILKNAKRVTTVSPQLEAVLRHLRVKRIQSIPNRVHDVFLNRPLVPREKGTFRFIHVSAFNDRQKQTSAIIRTFMSLHRSMPETELVLIVPKEKLEEFYENHEGADFSGIEHIEPGISRDAFCSLMMQCDALVSFSRYETFGLTVAEAVCCGLPVIYTACGGPESFVEPRMGVQVDPHDPESLLAAMKEITKNYPFDRQEIARVARVIFDKEQILLKYSMLYQSVVR